ncbi:hypothetical protein OHS70_33980 [Streptomyces sp. NBC_00390]|uniref:hypothetical protein n=1 Tax=Streptomyces sp. NBC_00390 TaxID=2975736 RepID=UPI002E221665
MTPEQIRNLIHRAERTPLTADEAARLRAGFDQLMKQTQSASEAEPEAGQAAQGKASWLTSTHRHDIGARIETLDATTPDGRYLTLITGAGPDLQAEDTTEADHRRARAEAYRASLEHVLDETSPEAPLSLAGPRSLRAIRPTPADS